MKPKMPESVWKIVDNTKLSAHMACPRKDFYEYVLGWRPIQDDHNLIYGQAFHMALEHLYDKQNKRDDTKLSMRDAEEAWLVFMEYYRRFYSEESDLDKAPKDPSNTERVLREYVELYSRIDRYKVVYSEISGAVPINTSGRLIYFRLDTVLYEPMSGTYMVLEHKTSKWSPTLWEASLSLSLQGGIGTHVLSCLYPADKVKGLTYNGIFLLKKGNEFRRMPYRRSVDGMQDWLTTINYYADKRERELDIYVNTDKEDAPCMHAFPKNPTSCVAYNKPCPYMDFCKAWANPLRHIMEAPPSGFQKKFWDPREQDKEWNAASAHVVKPEEVETGIGESIVQMELPFVEPKKG